jgi:hypothetical protein
LTSKAPPKGGELVEMVTLAEEEKPFARMQLRVKTKDDSGGRQFPTRTNVKTWGVLVEEEGKVRERGDNETEDKTMDSSFTDHCTSPSLDSILTEPKSFKFAEGFIFNPDNTSNLNRGEREGRIDREITFSQLLTSPEEEEEEEEDLPFMMSWNVSPTIANEELGVTITWEREEKEREEKMSEGQVSRYEGKVWKHCNSKDNGNWESGERLES